MSAPIPTHDIEALAARGFRPTPMGIAKFVANTIDLARTRLNRALNLDPVGRDLDKECGYLSRPMTAKENRLMFDTHGLFFRVVTVFPDECFSSVPEVYESEDPAVLTPFEGDIQNLNRRLGLWQVMHLADRMTGVGRFGGVLIGYGDRRPLNQPVVGLSDSGTPAQGRPPGKVPVLFMRVFDESLVEVKEWVTDESDPRYGQPRIYTLDLAGPDLSGPNSAEPQKTMKADVHWTRFVHLIDNPTGSPWCGIPRAQRVTDRLLDLRKVLGGSAEMYWKGGFPGFSIEALPELAVNGELDMDTVKEQTQAYFDHTSRVMALKGMTAKSLSSNITSPRDVYDVQISVICAVLSMPVPIFLGQVEGQAAGEQNAAMWNRRLAGRQGGHLDPNLVRPVIDRLVLCNAVTSPAKGPDQYLTSWSDLNSLTDLSSADVAVKLTQALLQYVTSGCYKFVRPIQFLTSVMNYDRDEALAMVAAAGGEQKVLAQLDQMMAMNSKAQNAQSGGKPGSPAKKTGQSGNRNSQKRRG